MNYRWTISDRLKFGRTILGFGNLVSEIWDWKFRSGKTGIENPVTFIPFLPTQIDMKEEFLAHIKMVCSQYDNIPPASAG